MYDICRIFAPRNIGSKQKELDAFSLEYMVDLQDYPERNAFPSGKDNPEMLRFDSGYYSFDEEEKMDGCFLHVQYYFGKTDER